MAKDHYLPASLIGRFSIDDAPSARERKVAVLRKGQRSAFSVKAEKVGFVNGLYDLREIEFWGDPIASVDPIITGYEPGLPHALDEIELGRPVTAEVWLRVLVPFVASLFVRAHEFEPRFLARPSVKAAMDYVQPGSANVGRLIEMERLLSPACCARWVVMHKVSGQPYVLNDLGLTGVIDRSTGAMGWSLSVGKHTILSIFPMHSRDVVIYKKGRWWANIQHVQTDASGAQSFSESMACRASSYVIGASHEIVERLASMVGRYADDAASLMEAWPIEPKARPAYSREWYRLVTAIHGDPVPETIGDLREVKLSAITAGWYPLTAIALNVREFPAGLERNGAAIKLTLRSPVGVPLI